MLNDFYAYVFALNPFHNAFMADFIFHFAKCTLQKQRKSNNILRYDERIIAQNNNFKGLISLFQQKVITLQGRYEITIYSNHYFIKFNNN